MVTFTMFLALSLFFSNVLMNLRETAYVMAVDLTDICAPFVPLYEICKHIYALAASTNSFNFNIFVWS